MRRRPAGLLWPALDCFGLLWPVLACFGLFWPVSAFNPRKGDLSLDIMPGLNAHRALLQRLWRHMHEQLRLHIRRLADLDLAVLDEVVRCAVAALARQRLQLVTN